MTHTRDQPVTETYMKTQHFTQQTNFPTSRQTLKNSIHLVLFTVTKISLSCVTTVSLQFSDQILFCYRKIKRSKLIHELSVIPYFIYFCRLCCLFSNAVHCTHTVTLRGVRVTIVPVEKLY